jgi:PAS domain S-box-containing protein
LTIAVVLRAEFGVSAEPKADSSQTVLSGKVGAHLSSRLKAMGLRSRIALTLAASSVVVFLFASALLYAEALDDRHATLHAMEIEAIATSNSFDREVLAGGALLQGLSSSPALINGDLRAFYDQLVATPRPEGSWFVLWDMEGQRLNTIRPFGARLPTRAEIGGTDDGYERIRQRGLSVSNLVIGPVAQFPTVNVHWRLDTSGGEMSGLLTMVLPQERIDAVLHERPARDGWSTQLLDRRLERVATSGRGDGAPDQLSPAIVRQVRGAPTRESTKADDGAVVAIVYRSELTGYSAVATAPLVVVNASVQTAMRQIAFAGAIVLLIGGIAGASAFRQVAPVEGAVRETRRRLRLAEARYASVWDNSPDGMFVIGVSDGERFTFEAINPALERATGFTFADLAGKEPSESLPGLIASAVSARYRACVESGRPMIYDETVEAPAGTRVWQTSLAPVRDPDTAEIVALVGMTRDVTTDREATQKVESSQRLLHNTLEALSAHIAVLDSTGEVVAINRAWPRGLDSGACTIGSKYIETFRPKVDDHDQRRLVGRLNDLLTGRADAARMIYGCEGHWFNMVASRFTSRGAAYLVVAHEDITDLIEARRDVREIAGRLLSSQDDERQRIAADLHDSTAQHLVAAGLELMRVQGAAGDMPGIAPAISRVRDALAEAHKEIRTLSYLLFPPDLRDTTMSASLRHLVSGFAARTGMDCELRIHGDVDGFSAEVVKTALRVIQEALVNALRHAEASRIRISVLRDDVGLHLRVADNGKGLPRPPAGGNGAAHVLGVGIPGMEARVRQFAGTFTISSTARGTAVRAMIPEASLHGEEARRQGRRRSA